MIFSRKIEFDKKAAQECPCGYFGDPSRRCHCTVEQVHRYRARLSGHLLGRIDIHVDVPRISLEVLQGSRANDEEQSASIQARVLKARDRALARSGQPNAAITPAQIKTFCRLNASGNKLLEQAMNQFGKHPQTTTVRSSLSLRVRLRVRVRGPE